MTEYRPDVTSSDWRESTIETLLLENLKEQRRVRRGKWIWRIFLIVCLLALIFFLTDIASWTTGTDSAHTAVVDLKGEISATSSASARNVIKGLQKAFEDDGTKGVILRINSPGGSAVQSGEIYDEILRLRAQYPHIPIYAVIEDTGASGAYYVAAATDQIFANRASFVGSIGVLIDGFGFTGLMDKIGVERRLITAGKYKGFLDEFSPINPEEVVYAQALVEQVRQQFVAAIKARRGDKIKNEDEVYTGLVWTGEQALPLGLIDGLSSTQAVALKLIGAKKLVDYTTEDDFLTRLSLKMSQAIAATVIANGADHASFKR